MQPLISVVIPNWNGGKYLERCIISLRKQTYPNFEIIVVDNNSTDASCEFIKKNPEIKLLLNSTNRGCAAGLNEGIKVARGEYIATLNNDAEVFPNWLESLLQPALNSPRVGICASQILYAFAPEIINSAGLVIKKNGCAYNRGDFGKRTVEFEKQQRVFGACAGAALYRRAMLDEIGVFDEDYFAYYEDVDLAWRAYHAGWECIYVPEAKVIHWFGVSAQKLGRKYFHYISERNKIWTIIKNWPLRAFIENFFWIMFFHLAFILYIGVVKRSFFPVKAYWEALRKSGRFIKKRLQQRCLNKNEKIKINFLTSFNPIEIWKFHQRKTKFLKRWSYLNIKNLFGTLLLNN
jgi:hypothetical protein